ncbi:hypothetical protein QR685DRAFT_536588 [Neurospora intermedia]|uniref:Secreted protein n=1 Tax=Neurospora intermedia TaxID=5142 RepID=A0ABR3CZV6_NEUIN
MAAIWIVSAVDSSAALCLITEVVSATLAGGLHIVVSHRRMVRQRGSSSLEVQVPTLANSPRLRRLSTAYLYLYHSTQSRTIGPLHLHC